MIVDLEPLRRLEIHWLPRSARLGFLWGPDEEPAGSGGALAFTLAAVPEQEATRLTVVEHAPAPAQALAVA